MASLDVAEVMSNGVLAEESFPHLMTLNVRHVVITECRNFKIVEPH